MASRLVDTLTTPSSGPNDAVTATLDGPSDDIVSHETIRPGTLVRRFVVTSKLGAGGMGEVWAAYDPTLDRKVAIKLLRASESDHKGGRREIRMLREAQAMARLNHRNVIAVHEVGTHCDRIFIAMELVEGSTLSTGSSDRGRRARSSRSWSRRDEGWPPHTVRGSSTGTSSPTTCS